MDGPGNKLTARSVLPLDEDRRRVAGEGLDLLEDPVDGVALADDVLDPVNDVLGVIRLRCLRAFLTLISSSGMLNGFCR